MNETPAQKALRILEGDLETMGWDQPMRVFCIENTIEDPVFNLLAEAQAHPIDVLQEAYVVGLRIPPNAVGIAIASEAWRNLSWPEIKGRDPRAIETIRGFFEKIRGADEPPLNDTEFEERCEHAWNRLMQKVRPSEQTEQNRHELRNIVAIFRTGEQVVIARDRGGEPDFVEETGGRVPEAMARFLRGDQPEPDEDEQKKWTFVPVNIDGTPIGEN